MSNEIRHYTNNEVTVVWNQMFALILNYAGKGLIEVFNPKERPWIK